MNKKKVLYILLFAMVAINVVLMVTFVSNGPPNKNHPEPKGIIIKKLSLEPNQVDAYELLIKQHSSTIQVIEDSIHESQKALYSLLRTDNQRNADSISSILGAYQIEIEKTHFNHFMELKKICKPEQINAFNELTFELEALFSHKPKHPKKDK